MNNEADRLQVLLEQAHERQVRPCGIVQGRWRESDDGSVVVVISLVREESATRVAG